MIAYYSYLSAAVGFAFLTILLLFSWRSSVQGKLLTLVSGTTAVWALVAAHVSREDLFLQQDMLYQGLEVVSEIEPDEEPGEPSEYPAQYAPSPRILDLGVRVSLRPNDSICLAPVQDREPVGYDGRIEIEIPVSEHDEGMGSHLDAGLERVALATIR